MAVTADSVVVELEARLDSYTAKINGGVRDFDQGMSRIERSASRAENAVVQFSGRAGNATRNLGRQIADVGTSLASGSSPFIILAQQAPQVADALADTGGKAARLAGFFAGPWGAAFLAAGSVMGVLVGKLLDGGAAADVQKGSVKSLASSIDDLNEAMGKQIRTSQQAEQQAYREAAANRAAANSARDRTAAALNKAKADLSAANATEATGQVTPIPGRGAASRGAIVAALDRQLEANEAARRAADSGVALARIPILQRQVVEATDKAAAATGRYDRAVASLNERLLGGKINNDAYVKELAKATNARDAVLNAGKTASAAKRAAAKAEAERRREVREAAKTAKLQASEADGIGILNHKYGDPIGVVDDARLRPLAADTSIDNITREVDRITDAVSRGLDDGFRESEDKVRDLASLYEDAFRGGTGSIWQTFKEEGLRTIALLLARFTLLQATQGSGGLANIGSNLASAAKSVFSAQSGGSAGTIASLFGRASGGYAAPHSLHRVNEGSGRAELLRMGPQGGTVIPLGQMKAAQRGGGSTRVYNISVSADHSVTPAGFAKGLASQILQEAQRMDARAGKALLSAVPGRLSQFSTDGT